MAQKSEWRTLRSSKISSSSRKLELYNLTTRCLGCLGRCWFGSCPKNGFLLSVIAVGNIQLFYSRINEFRSCATWTLYDNYVVAEWIHFHGHKVHSTENHRLLTMPELVAMALFVDNWTCNEIHILSISAPIRNLRAGRNYSHNASTITGTNRNQTRIRKSTSQS